MLLFYFPNLDSQDNACDERTSDILNGYEASTCCNVLSMNIQSFK